MYVIIHKKEESSLNISFQEFIFYLFFNINYCFEEVSNLFKRSKRFLPQSPFKFEVLTPILPNAFHVLLPQHTFTVLFLVIPDSDLYYVRWIPLVGEIVKTVEGLCSGFSTRKVQFSLRVSQSRLLIIFLKKGSNVPRLLFLGPIKPGFVQIQTDWALDPVQFEEKHRKSVKYR